MTIKPLNLLTTKLSPLTTMVAILILIILSFYSFHFPHSLKHSNKSTTFQSLFLSSSSNSTISSYLRTLTMHPHLAGTKSNSNTALFVLNHFTSLNLKSHTTSYNVLLSYPLNSSLSIHLTNGSFLNLPLTEPGLDVVHAYHAYSPSGSVYAKAVFVNYGREIDYHTLGVDVKGCIVIARKGGGLGRGTVVEKAEKNGAAAVLIYNDEGDTWRNGFERGNVMKGVGDPVSPGWGSVDGSERLSLEDNEVLERFPKIPSMPISADVADAILSSLGDNLVPLEWRNSLKSKGVISHVGPGPTMLNFTYLVSTFYPLIYLFFC